jgi:hypothetical protein
MKNWTQSCAGNARAANRFIVQRTGTALLLATALAIAGCADTQPIRSSRPATTSTAGDIRLSDAEDMADLEADDVQITLTDKLEVPDTTDTIYFGEADEFDTDDTANPTAAMPLIATHWGSTWKAVPLVGTGLTNAGWKYVGAGPGPHEVWGVLDTSAGDSRSQFVVAHSTDGAATFSLRAFRKPCRLAAVADFAMSRNGHGRVTLSLDADCGTNRAGLYHYQTTDDGKSWSKQPSYEPDAMLRADDVPDDEQPDLMQPATRTLLKPGRLSYRLPNRGNALPSR